MPGIGGGPGAIPGALDFLRNNAQVCLCNLLTMTTAVFWCRKEVESV